MKRVQHWRRILNDEAGTANSTRLRIGLSWQGDPNFPADRVRSIPLQNFRPLLELPGIQWISLQRGFGTEQLEEITELDRIANFGDKIDAGEAAFVDSIAIMRSLDLVITSDTSIAHLAGACGVKTWIGLNRVPDWRWNLNRADSPWYANVELFRQAEHGNWKTVFSQIASRLRQM
jgi:hypothetical protein